MIVQARPDKCHVHSIVPRQAQSQGKTALYMARFGVCWWESGLIRCLKVSVDFRNTPVLGIFDVKKIAFYGRSPTQCAAATGVRSYEVAGRFFICESSLFHCLRREAGIKGVAIAGIDEAHMRDRA